MTPAGADKQLAMTRHFAIMQAAMADLNHLAARHETVVGHASERCRHVAGFNKSTSDGFVPVT